MPFKQASQTTQSLTTPVEVQYTEPEEEAQPINLTTVYILLGTNIVLTLATLVLQVMQ